jgi:hypothetical protein
MDGKRFIADQLVNVTELCDDVEMAEVLSQVDGYNIQGLVKAWYDLGHNIYVNMYTKGVEGMVAADMYIDAFIGAFKK